MNKAQAIEYIDDCLPDFQDAFYDSETIDDFTITMMDRSRFDLDPSEIKFLQKVYRAYKHSDRNVTYVLIRLDENVEPEEAMQDLIENVKGVEIVQHSKQLLEDEIEAGGPIIYYP